jgi:Glycosyltransferase family 87
VVAVVAGAKRAATQHVGTDFHVFWQAGYDFAHGLPLYHPLPGARRFIYPPFAAQSFQLLGILPLKAAAGAFYLANVALILAAIVLTRDIVRRLMPVRRSAILPLALGAGVSATFMLDNLSHVQVNQLTFVLSLLGVRALLDRRDAAAGGWLVTATSIKITPVFFVIWAVIRGTRRTTAAVAAFAGLCVGLPILQRGLSRGVADLADYYHTFLHQFASGGVVTSFRNQNLAGMIYRALVPSAGRDATHDYAYLSSLAPAAPWVYRLAAVLLLAVYLAYLIRRRFASRPVSALEVSAVFLAAHLLSGITWKTHLVTLLFVAYVFFSLHPGLVDGWKRGAVWLAWMGLVVIGLGRDVIGGRLHHYMAGYSVYVWVMVLLLALSFTWSERDKERLVSP